MNTCVTGSQQAVYVSAFDPVQSSGDKLYGEERLLDEGKDVEEPGAISSLKAFCSKEKSRTSHQLEGGACEDRMARD